MNRIEAGIMNRIKAGIRKDYEVNELGALLRYSQVPTLVVEGKDDVRVYHRWVERRLLGTYRVDVLAANGRANLLRLYEQRSEFVHAPVIFLVDRGMWLFSGIPEGYEDIICTNGFSIYNDVYMGAKLETLLTSDEAKKYKKVRSSIIKWFAFEVEEWLAARAAGNNEDNMGPVSFNLRAIIPRGSTKIHSGFLKRRGFRSPNVRIVQQIENEYERKLPGKLLFQMLTYFLNAPRREPSLSRSSLFPIAISMSDSGSLSGRLVREIRKKIEAGENSIGLIKNR